MSRLIFVPQYPTPMRYQEWWLSTFLNEFQKYFDEVITLGYDYCGSSGLSYDPSLFSPIDASIEWENRQIEQYMHMKIYNDDIMFVSDLSFPGLFPTVLYHKRPSKVFMFCHATSMNTLDYYELYRGSKFLVERGFAAMCDKVFVGSYYHEKKLEMIGNTCVTYLPYPPLNITTSNSKTFDQRANEVVSVSRPTQQKVDLDAEKLIEKSLNVDIIRGEFKTWREYYDFLGNSKCMLITSKEETFGYQVVDAVISGCTPIAPKEFSYPELLHEQFLYDTRDDMVSKVHLARNNSLDTPYLLCDRDMRKFFYILIHMMKG